MNTFCAKTRALLLPSTTTCALLTLTVLLLFNATVSAENAIYNTKGRQVNLGNGNITELVTRGFLVLHPDAKKGVAVGGFTTNDLKFFAVVPLQNYRFETVSGPGGSTYLIVAKAESPGTQFAGTILESVYSWGRNVTVTIGPNGARSLPKVFTGGANGLLTSPTGATITAQSHSTVVLDIRASAASNIARESIDAVAARLATYFVARGYVQVKPEPAQ